MILTWLCFFHFLLFGLLCCISHEARPGQYQYNSTANMLVVLVPQVHGCQPVQTRRNQVSTNITPLLYKTPNITPCRCLITPYRCLITPFSGYFIEKLRYRAKKKHDIAWPKNRSKGYIALVHSERLYSTGTNIWYITRKQLYHMLYSKTLEPWQVTRLYSTII